MAILLLLIHRSLSHQKKKTQTKHWQGAKNSDKNFKNKEMMETMKLGKICIEFWYI